jgi:hypothetical protein
VDEARLRPHLRRRPVERKRTPAEAVAEAEQAVVVALGAAGGDARALRGVPCVSKGGMGSAMPGTDPLEALLAKEHRRG